MPFNLFAPNVPASTAYDLTPPDISAPAPSSNPFFFQASPPTKEGSLEYSPAFRKAAGSAWMATTSGGTAAGAKRAEAGFWVGNNGTPGVLSVWFDGEHRNSPGATIPVIPNTMALFHTHPDYAGETPSQTDINSARSSKRTIYVQSRVGLYAIDPGGQVTHLFNNPGWMASKNPQ